MQKEIQIRGGISRALKVFRNRKKGRIAFIGGSITEMNGYTALTSEMFRQLFPRCNFRFVNAGISSTCSNTGAFRFGKDVLKKGKTDLLFIEFAVNDNQDGHLPPAASIRAMEGLVRQALRSNPAMDIVFLYTANESHNETFRNGKVPREIRAMEKVARHYHISSINFAVNVARSLAEGKYDWQKDFGGVHPAPFGNRIYCNMIKQLVEYSPDNSERKMPEKLLDANSLVSGKLLPVSAASHDKNWKIGIPDWENLPGAKRVRFTNIPTLFSDVPGAEFSLKFNGNCIGLYLTAGPDAGTIRYSIDGNPFKSTDLFHPYSGGLHYPYTKMLAEKLTPGKHSLVIRIGKKRNPSSKGNAVRIVNFSVNSL